MAETKLRCMDHRARCFEFSAICVLKCLYVSTTVNHCSEMALRSHPLHVRSWLLKSSKLRQLLEYACVCFFVFRAVRHGGGSSAVCRMLHGKWNMEASPGCMLKWVMSFGLRLVAFSMCLIGVMECGAPSRLNASARSRR